MLRAGKDVAHLRVEAPVVAVGRTAVGPDRAGGRQRQRRENRVEDVAAHVAERAGAEVEPLSPFARVVVMGQITAARRRRRARSPSSSSVGIGSLRSGRGLLSPQCLPLQLCTSLTLPIVPAWMVATIVRCTSWEWIWMPIWVTSFFSRPPRVNLPGLVDRLGQRFLGVDVQSLLHRPHGDRGVHVVRRGDVDRVEVLLLVEQLAPVLVDLDAGEAILDLVQVSRDRRRPRQPA